MKKFFFVLLIMSGLLSARSQQGYTVRTKISNPDKYPMILGYFDGDKFVIDTGAVMENGWTVFRGKVAEPMIASLIIRRDPALSIQVDRGFIPGPSCSFFLTNESITIVGDAHTVYMAAVSGGKANDEWATIREKENGLIQESWVALKKTHDEFKPGDDSAVFIRVQQLRSDNQQKEEALHREFIAKNPHSLVSMYFLSNMLNSLSFEELKVSYAKLGDEYKGSIFGKRITEKIQSMEATAIGKAAIPIDKKDANGNPVNLQTLKGKYVLIDFWGSWCGPCRESHPYLKKLYKKYKDKGLEIVGIAQEQMGDLEKDRRIWLDAVKTDGLDWIQVLNNDGIRQFDAVKAYGITAFPTKILLDKDGRIIDRMVGEEEGPLTAKLKEIFGE